MKNFICLLLLLVAGVGLSAQTTTAVTTAAAVVKEDDLVTQIFGKNKESLFSEFLKISLVEERAF